MRLSSERCAGAWNCIRIWRRKKQTNCVGSIARADLRHHHDGSASAVPSLPISLPLYQSVLEKASADDGNSSTEMPIRYLEFLHAVFPFLTLIGKISIRMNTAKQDRSPADANLNAELWRQSLLEIVNSRPATQMPDRQRQVGHGGSDDRGQRPYRSGRVTEVLARLIRERGRRYICGPTTGHSSLRGQM
jgi:hypothetical protein